VLLGACGRGVTPTATTAPTATPIGDPVAVDGGSYRQVSPAELRQMLDDGGVTLVNVHIPYAGEIEPTDLFIAYNEITSKTDQLPDKDAVIVLYCLSGGMSSEVAPQLVKLGYSRIYELRGGMQAWEAAGYPLKK
jgi:rhodanese-related sulfurtransferase